MEEYRKEELITDYIRAFIKKEGDIMPIMKASCIQMYNLDWWADYCEKYAGKLQEDNDELTRLFDLQHTRMGQATKYWQKKTGRKNVHPDLGNLLEFLLNEIKELKK